MEHPKDRMCRLCRQGDAVRKRESPGLPHIVAWWPKGAEPCHEQGWSADGTAGWPGAGDAR